MADSLQEGLRAELTCGVCLDTYNDPRQLPCQHSFCLRCLKGIRIIPLPGPCPATHLHGIACPVCRKNYPLSSKGVEGFSPDFKLNKFINIYKKHEESSSKRDGKRNPEKLAASSDVKDTEAIDSQRESTFHSEPSSTARDEKEKCSGPARQSTASTNNNNDGIEEITAYLQELGVEENVDLSSQPTTGDQQNGFQQFCMHHHPHHYRGFRPPPPPHHHHHPHHHPHHHRHPHPHPPRPHHPHPPPPHHHWHRHPPPHHPPHPPPHHPPPHHPPPHHPPPHHPPPHHPPPHHPPHHPPHPPPHFP